MEEHRAPEVVLSSCAVMPEAGLDDSVQPKGHPSKPPRLHRLRTVPHAERSGTQAPHLMPPMCERSGHGRVSYLKARCIIRP